MPGFFVSVGSSVNGELRKSRLAEMVSRKKKLNNAFVESYVIKKFIDEKLFYETEELLIVTDGVLLNSGSKSHDELGQFFANSYRENGINFLKTLRGNFSGLIFDKSKRIWHLYTDQTASKPIYWFFDKEKKIFAASSELKSLTHYLRVIGRKNSLDVEGAYCLLTFGFMLEDLTLIKGIRKLRAGSYIELRENDFNLTVQPYYEFDNTPIYKEEKKILGELTYLFFEAVRLEYEKDAEYGYQSIAQLSGGLDSKTAVIVAVKEGFRPVTLCFSESDYLDEKIAKKVARDNRLELIFHSLDNGIYLISTLEDSLEANDGLVLYIGAAHVLNTLKKIDKNTFGIMHTGIGGDGVLGAYLKNNKLDYLSFNKFSEYAYSKVLVEKLKEYHTKLSHIYPNYELFAFYNRVFNGMYNGYRIIEQYYEFSSPFTYLDFMEYALRISPEKRYKEKIYVQWLEKMIPEVSKYPWEKKLGLPPYASRFHVKLKHLIRRIKVKFFDYRLYSMNPFDYWEKHNPEILEYMNRKFDELKPYIEGYPDLLKDCEYLFSNGNLIEKSQVLTLLAAIRLHDIE